MAVWQLQTAKAKLSELLRAVREHGPQTISVRGKEEFVVTKVEATPANQARKTGLDLFRPVLELGLTLDLPSREPEGHRKLWFEDEEGEDGDIADPTKPR